jgi:phosphate starvation-inducible PhoH-like protein
MRSKPKTNRSRANRVERRKDKRELKRNPSDYSVPEQTQVTYVAKKEIEPLRALTEAQGQYIASIIANTITFSVGPQGTGKSYVAGAFAAEQLKLGLVEKIIITRPGVESGRNWGALPGTLEEKYAPFMEPFNDVLEERLGKTFFEYLKKTGRIIASPLEFMRGKTFKDSIVILDEAQNVDTNQMLMFLTRIGENSKMIIDGSITQCDIRNSGLAEAVRRLQQVPSIGFIEFTTDDIVRHGIIKDILMAYAA